MNSMSAPEPTPTEHPPEWASGPPSDPEQPVSGEMAWDDAEWADGEPGGDDLQVDEQKGR
jgi:hypothetical protein